MILGVETSLPSFPEDEGKDSLLHIMLLLMYFLLFSLMLQMQHRGGSIIILSFFHVFFFLTWTARRINMMYVSEIQLELIVLRKSYLDFMNEWLKYALF